MKIAVTQEHIDKGQSTPCSCPIALALLDAGLEDPRVGRTHVTWVGPDGWRRRSLPARARSFVFQFDHAYYNWGVELPEPFEFDIDLPEPATHDGPRRTVDAPAVHGGGRVVAGE